MSARVTLRQAAERFGRSDGFVLALIHSGQLPAVKISGRWMIHRAAIAWWLKGDSKWSALDHSTFVYFFESCGLVKVGTSANWRARLSALQCTSAAPIRPVMVITGGERLERALHAMWREHRSHGEWFLMPSEWRDSVRSIASERGCRIELDESA